MKKTLFFALVLALTASMLKAQYYGGIGSIRGGRINVFGGIHNGMTGGTEFYGSKVTTEYGYSYQYFSETQPTTMNHNMSACLGIDFSVLNDRNESFLIGATAGIFGNKNKIHATFDKATLGRPYDTEIDIESNQIDLHIGIAGMVYIVPEKVSIDFSIGPGALFTFGDQVRYRRTPTQPNDTRDNAWGDASKVDDFMKFPNIDIMAFARIGVSYHITDIMWVGALFQYHQPIIAFGGENTAEYVIRSVNDDIRYIDRKHKDWAALLTWGIDLD